MKGWTSWTPQGRNELSLSELLDDEYHAARSASPENSCLGPQPLRWASESEGFQRLNSTGAAGIRMCFDRLSFDVNDLRLMLMLSLDEIVILRT